MTPLYNSEKGKIKRPRIRKRNIGEMPKALREEAQKLGISKMAVGLTLLNLGIDVLQLNLR